MNLCTDCKYIERSPLEKPGKPHCLRPNWHETSPITGEPSELWERCFSERCCGVLVSWALDKCGERARFFKPIVQKLEEVENT